MTAFETVEQAMDEAIAQKIFPGAVLLVRSGDREIYHRAFGHRSLEPTITPLNKDTIFDVSSLTKPFATTLAIMLMVRDGIVRLDDNISRFFHNFGVHGKTHVTWRHLLNHSSGLAAWRPYYKEIRRIEEKEGRLNFLGSLGAKEYVFNRINLSLIHI